MEDNIIPMIPRPNAEWIKAFQAFCDAFNAVAWRKENRGRVSLSTEDLSRLILLADDAGMCGPVS